MPGHNKLCELEDFRDPTLRRYAAETYLGTGRCFVPGYEHRKHWEVAQTARALAELGAAHPGAELLGVGAGIELTTFWATGRARRVFATDRYMDAGGWESNAPRSMLTNPAKHARGPFEERRLVVQHMDARELRFEDASFDGAFCTSSVEHFGDHEDVRRAVAELWRVLKPGGIATFTTEYRLCGPGPGLPGTLIFDAAELEELIVDPYAWDLVEPLDLNVSEATLATEQSLSVALAGAARLPHLVLVEGELAFTSIHFALRKR